MSEFGQMLYKKGGSLHILQVMREKTRLITLFSRPHFEAAFCALFKICDHCVIFTKATLFINQVEHPAYGKSRNSFQHG